ncbi:hypothetical protein EJ03DRAFT_267297 [Teratosphaeria nubilosa]|uniref:GCN5-related N-acetyltransferase Rv2170-like domain-containing protein n=1 Tax=Teratosphaeria nubilosa TaxID=161662 RepID=A0A6G1LHL4_9PEZI|nr:hypothetical protein EJ03DRAFT_267297 [Teratosphaeria nubilosa]
MSPDDEKDSVGYSRNDYAGHASNPDIMLWGAIHERTVPILQELGVLSTDFKTGLVPNSTFVFKVDHLPQVRPLPAGLKWSTVEPKDFALVRSRTQIPRQERTMAVLPSLAIRTEESEPVAWAFVGLDGSLTTLHVESEWRGRGLAKAIATKLFREKMHSFWEAEVEKISHGYVVSGNEASEATCRSLGGRCGWQSYWLRVDLGKV